MEDYPRGGGSTIGGYYYPGTGPPSSSNSAAPAGRSTAPRLSHSPASRPDAASRSGATNAAAVLAAEYPGAYGGYPYPHHHQAALAHSLAQHHHPSGLSPPNSHPAYPGVHVADPLRYTGSLSSSGYGSGSTNNGIDGRPRPPEPSSAGPSPRSSSGGGTAASRSRLSSASGASAAPRAPGVDAAMSGHGHASQDKARGSVASAKHYQEPVPSHVLAAAGSSAHYPQPPRLDFPPYRHVDAKNSPVNTKSASASNSRSSSSSSSMTGLPYGGVEGLPRPDQLRHEQDPRSKHPADPPSSYAAANAYMFQQQEQQQQYALQQIRQQQQQHHHQQLQHHHQQQQQQHQQQLQKAQKQAHNQMHPQAAKEIAHRKADVKFYTAKGSEQLFSAPKPEHSYDIAKSLEENMTTIRRVENPFASMKNLEVLNKDSRIISENQQQGIPAGHTNGGRLLNQHLFDSSPKLQNTHSRLPEPKQKEDCVLDLSVKTMRKTPDSTAPDMDSGMALNLVTKPQNSWSNSISSSEMPSSVYPQSSREDVKPDIDQLPKPWSNNSLYRSHELYTNKSVKRSAESPAAARSKAARLEHPTTTDPALRKEAHKPPGPTKDDVERLAAHKLVAAQAKKGSAAGRYPNEYPDPNVRPGAGYLSSYGHSMIGVAGDPVPANLLTDFMKSEQGHPHSRTVYHSIGGELSITHANQSSSGQGYSGGGSKGGTPTPPRGRRPSKSPSGGIVASRVPYSTFASQHMTAEAAASLMADERIITRLPHNSAVASAVAAAATSSSSSSHLSDAVRTAREVHSSISSDSSGSGAHPLTPSRVPVSQSYGHPADAGSRSLDQHIRHSPHYQSPHPRASPQSSQPSPQPRQSPQTVQSSRPSPHPSPHAQSSLHRQSEQSRQSSYLPPPSGPAPPSHSRQSPHVPSHSPHLPSQSSRPSSQPSSLCRASPLPSPQRQFLHTSQSSHYRAGLPPPSSSPRTQVTPSPLSLHTRASPQSLPSPHPTPPPRSLPSPHHSTYTLTSPQTVSSHFMPTLHSTPQPHHSMPTPHPTPSPHHTPAPSPHRSAAPSPNRTYSPHPSLSRNLPGSQTSLSSESIKQEHVQASDLSINSHSSSKHMLQNRQEPSLLVERKDLNGVKTDSSLPHLLVCKEEPLDESSSMPPTERDHLQHFKQVPNTASQVLNEVYSNQKPHSNIGSHSVTTTVITAAETTVQSSSASCMPSSNAAKSEPQEGFAKEHPSVTVTSSTGPSGVKVEVSLASYTADNAETSAAVMKIERTEQTPYDRSSNSQGSHFQAPALPPSDFSLRHSELNRKPSAHAQHPSLPAQNSTSSSSQHKETSQQPAHPMDHARYSQPSRSRPTSKSPHTPRSCSQPTLSPSPHSTSRSPHPTSSRSPYPSPSSRSPHPTSRSPHPTSRSIQTNSRSPHPVSAESYSTQPYGNYPYHPSQSTHPEYPGSYPENHPLYPGPHFTYSGYFPSPTTTVTTVSAHSTATTSTKSKASTQQKATSRVSPRPSVSHTHQSAPPVSAYHQSPMQSAPYPMPQHSNYPVDPAYLQPPSVHGRSSYPQTHPSSGHPGYPTPYPTSQLSLHGLDYQPPYHHNPEYPYHYPPQPSGYPTHHYAEPYPSHAASSYSSSSSSRPSEHQQTPHHPSHGTTAAGSDTSSGSPSSGSKSSTAGLLQSPPAAHKASHQPLLQQPSSTQAQSFSGPIPRTPVSSSSHSTSHQPGPPSHAKPRSTAPPSSSHPPSHSSYPASYSTSQPPGSSLHTLPYPTSHPSAHPPTHSPQASSHPSSHPHAHSSHPSVHTHFPPEHTPKHSSQPPAHSSSRSPSNSSSQPHAHPSHPSSYQSSQPPTNHSSSHPPSYPSSHPPAHTSHQSAHPSTHPPAHPSSLPPAHPSSHPSVHSSSHPAVHFSSHPPAHSSSHPSSHPPAHPSSYSPAHPSSHPPAHPSSHPPAHPSSHPPAHPSSHPPAPPSSHPSAHPYSHPPAHPSSHPPAHPSSHPPAHPSSHPPAHPSSHPPAHASSHPPAHASSHPPTHPSSLPPAHPSSRPPAHPSSHPPAHPSSHPPAHPSSHPPAHPSSHPPAHPSSNPPTQPSSYPPARPSFYAHPSSHLSAHPSSLPPVHSSSHPPAPPSSHPPAHHSYQPPTNASSQPSSSHPLLTSSHPHDPSSRPVAPSTHPYPPSEQPMHPPSQSSNYHSANQASYPSSHSTSQSPVHPPKHKPTHPSIHPSTDPSVHPSPHPSPHPSHPPAHHQSPYPASYPPSHPYSHHPPTSHQPAPPHSFDTAHPAVHSAGHPYFHPVVSTHATSLTVSTPTKSSPAKEKTSLAQISPYPSSYANYYDSYGHPSSYHHPQYPTAPGYPPTHGAPFSHQSYPHNTNSNQPPYQAHHPNPYAPEPHPGYLTSHPSYMYEAPSVGYPGYPSEFSGHLTEPASSATTDSVSPKQVPQVNASEGKLEQRPSYPNNQFPPHSETPHSLSNKTTKHSTDSQYPVTSPVCGQVPSMPDNKSVPTTLPSNTGTNTKTETVEASAAVNCTVEETDSLRIKTKAEQKAFDPNKSDSQSVLMRSQSLPSLNKDPKDKLISKAAQEKTREPGKAALAEKLHKKFVSEKNLPTLTVKQEPEDDNKVNHTIKKEPSDSIEEASLDWNFNLDKFMTDLSNNRDVTTSRKTKTLGKRYEQKLSIQHAIDNNEVAPVPLPVSEPETENEAEPLVKFRGKFKSIKDKSSNERIILTYASHSDESCTELIPDEDASDFEMELQKEIIGLKKKKHAVNHKTKRKHRSSSSESEKKDLLQRRNQSFKNSGIQFKSLKSSKSGRSRRSDDTDFSPGSSDDDTGSNSTSSDSNDSDSDNSNSSEESNAPQRARKRRPADTDSSEEDQAEVSRRSQRRRPALKPKTRPLSDWSDDEDDAAPSRRNKRGGKIKKASSEEDDAYKPPRSARIKTRSIKDNKRKRSSPSPGDSEDDDKGSVSTRKRRKEAKRMSRRENSIRREKNKKENKSRQTSAGGKSDSSSVSDEKPSIKHKKKKIKKTFIKSESESDSDNCLKKTSPNKRLVDSDSDEGTNDVKRERPSPALSEASNEPVNDSILEKLRQQRDEEQLREDVILEKSRRLEISRKMKERLDKLHEAKFRQSWTKPKFGVGETFYAGWQEGLLKFKKEFARLPKKLLYSKSLGSMCLEDFAQHKSTNKRKQMIKNSPAKNTRSKAVTNHLSIFNSDKPKGCLQILTEKILSGEDGRGTDSDTGNSIKKFALDSFPAFGTLRTPTGLTPTPSVAPSMMASDDSDSDSLASRRSPASDSAPLARRKSVASQLIKKLRRKYHRVDTAWLNRPRSVLSADESPKLLPTPGLDTSNQMDLRQLTTFFRKDTVEAHTKVFDELLQNNGINIFSTTLLQSRTRKETKQLLDEATIKSVFGDVPRKAETPLIAKKISTKKLTPGCKSAALSEGRIPDDSNSLPAWTRPSTPSDSGAVQGSAGDDSELPCEGSDPTMVDTLDDTSLSLFGVASALHPHIIKKHKRKHKINKSSGFDYLRKKKRPVPKTVDDDATVLSLKKKAQPVRRQVLWPEETKDIAGEVRTWVVNKHLGETVLHKAARTNCHDAIIYCLESPEYDVNARDNAGYTPLHEACNRGHLATAQALLAHGALVNAAGHGGVRPLHEATENGHAELTRLLLSYGADPTLCTYSGQHPSDLTSSDSACYHLLHHHLLDITGLPGSCWDFAGPVSFMDETQQGYNVFSNIPSFRSSILPSRPPIKKKAIAHTDQCSHTSHDALKEGFFFEESEAMLPDIFVHRASSQRFMLLEDVLSFLKLPSMKELVLRASLTCNSSIESRTERLRNFTAYDWSSVRRNGWLRSLRRPSIKLVRYTACLRRLMGVTETLVQ